MLPSNHDPNRPWTLLPLPAPMDYSPTEDFGDDFFYKNVARPLIKDTIRIMQNGLPIDLNKVAELEKTVDSVLSNVEAILDTNQVIQDYYRWKYPVLLKEHIAEYTSKIQTADKYFKAFNPKDIDHRSYYMHCYIEANPTTTFDIIPPIARTVTDLPKWTLNDVKKLVSSYPDLTSLAANSVPTTDRYAKQAANLLAQHKADKFNHRHEYITKLNRQSINDIVPKFNPASPDQKHELLTGMLGYESDTLTKGYKEWQQQVQKNAKWGTPIEKSTPKNKYSWPREELEKLQNMTPETDPFWQFLQALVDHSFAAIVKTNFIESFYTYTIGDNLHGQYKLLGAKSGRFTSSNPNMLNSPSTGSIYAKPIKKCFTAPPGFIVAGIDYSALEDRVIASLTGDTNKCAVFLEGVDGHSLAACAYFPDAVSKEMALTGDSVADAKEFKRLMDEGNKTLKALRQDSKPVTFGLSLTT